jgi:hypothetical protein
MPWNQLNETIECLRREAAAMERSPSAAVKEAAKDMRRHIEMLEAERRLYDPRPHIL